MFMVPYGTVKSSFQLVCSVCLSSNRKMGGACPGVSIPTLSLHAFVTHAPQDGRVSLTAWKNERAGPTRERETGGEDS